MTFFGLKQGQDLENRAAQYPHQEFPEIPPGVPVIQKGELARLIITILCSGKPAWTMNN